MEKLIEILQAIILIMTGIAGIGVGLFLLSLYKSIKKGKATMPIGTVLVSTNRYELTTLPGAFVTVRRMTYGEELERTGMATKFKMGGQSGMDKDNFQGELDINTKIVALWDFANLIVDHNIQDASERILNFKNASDVNMLDPTVGKEIGEFIDAWQVDVVKDSTEVKN